MAIGLELRAGDVAARANFCTIDDKGIVTDRRAGRIETAVCEELVDLLSKKVKKVGDAEVIIKAGKGHRFVVIFRGKGLEGPLSDADPHREGEPIPSAECIDPKNAKQKKAAKLIGEFTGALPLIAKRKRRTRFLMRGIAHQPRSLVPGAFTSSGQPAWRSIQCTRAWLPIGRHDKLEGGKAIREQFEPYLANTTYDLLLHPLQRTRTCMVQMATFDAQKESHRGVRRRPAHPSRKRRMSSPSPGIIHALRSQRPILGYPQPVS